MRGMCIDLGTENTYISTTWKNESFKEPSFVTVDMDNNLIIDAGSVSKEALGKTPEGIEVIRPLFGGVIADYSAAEGMVKTLVRKACQRTSFTGVSAIVTVPGGATLMERRAAAETLKGLGVNNVYTISAPLASAIGAGVNVLTPTGSMVVDIGAGTSDFGVIALGKIASGKCIKEAGYSMDTAVVNYVKRKYNVLIGENTGEKIKIELGTAVSKENNSVKKYKGRDISTGLPADFNISSEEIREVIKDIIKEIIDSALITLEKTPPELLSDVMENGIILTGACSQIYGMAELFTLRTGFKTTVAKNPEGATLRGTERIMADKKLRMLLKND